MSPKHNCLAKLHILSCFHVLNRVKEESSVPVRTILCILRTHAGVCFKCTHDQLFFLLRIFTFGVNTVNYLELCTDAGWFLLLMEVEKRLCNAIVQCQVS